MNQTKEITICTSCKGIGVRPYYNYETLFDYNLKTTLEIKPCRTCDGKGRLLKVTTYEKLKEGLE